MATTREILFKLRIDDSGLQKLSKFEQRIKHIREETEKTAKKGAKSNKFLAKSFKVLVTEVQRVGKALQSLGKLFIKAFRKLEEISVEFLKNSINAFQNFEMGMARIAKVSGSSIKDIEGLGKAYEMQSS